MIIRSHARSTTPALLSVPSTFRTGLGVSSLTVPRPNWATVSGSMKFSVAPQSKSAFTSALLRYLHKSNSISRDLTVECRIYCTWFQGGRS